LVLAAAVLALGAHTTFLSIKVFQSDYYYSVDTYIGTTPWVSVGWVAVAIGTAGLTLLILIS
jgi:hypothetical protein